MGYYYSWDGYEQRDVSVLQGMTLASVVYDKGLEEIKFTADDGRVFIMHHSQDCCESVGVEEIIGNLDDLVGAPIILAEDVSSEASETCRNFCETDTWMNDESFTWTFYRFRTAKGDVDIRWYGSSNGYYSERVDFIEVKEEEAA